jgi:hypothetical protein
MRLFPPSNLKKNDANETNSDFFIFYSGNPIPEGTGQYT